MARIRYIGELERTTVFGATFFRLRWTATHGLSPADVARLAANPTFEVDDGEEPAPAPKPKSRPAPSRAAAHLSV